MTPIPSMTPAENFDADVWPNYQDYMADIGSERKAKNVAYAVGHFHEWVFHYYRHHDPSRLYGKTNPTEFRDHIIDNLCPELQILCDISDASKHRFLTRHLEKRIVTTSTEAFLNDDGRLYMPDCNLHFDEALEKVVTFWRSWLNLP